jgi:hypothetical protein
MDSNTAYMMWHSMHVWDLILMTCRPSMITTNSVFFKSHGQLCFLLDLHVVPALAAWLTAASSCNLRQEIAQRCKLTPWLPLCLPPCTPAGPHLCPSTPRRQGHTRRQGCCCCCCCQGRRQGRCCQGC